MPERQILEQELFTVPEHFNQGPQQHGDDVEHRSMSFDANRWELIPQHADKVFAAHTRPAGTLGYSRFGFDVEDEGG